MKLQDFYNKYKEKHVEVEEIGLKIDTLKDRVRNKKEEIQRLEDRISNLAKKKDRLSCKYHWVDMIIKPLAEILVPYFPDYEQEVMGPFGICCEVIIFFKRKGVFEEELFEEGNSLRLTVVPRTLLEDPQLFWVDYSANTGKIAEHTIGAINGMNHPRYLIDPEMDVKELVALFK